MSVFVRDLTPGRYGPRLAYQTECGRGHVPVARKPGLSESDGLPTTVCRTCRCPIILDPVLGWLVITRGPIE